MTTFKDGTTEEGKYKNNHFIPYKKKKLMVRSKKVREKIDNAIKAAKKAAETARQKAEIAISRQLRIISHFYIEKMGLI